MSNAEIGLGTLPPQAPDVEEAVLGALMLEKDALSILPSLKPGSFYTEAHNTIYEAIHNLARENKPVDMLTVSNQLRKMSKLETVGGQMRLAELTNTVVSSANIETHVSLIKEMFLRRELIRIGSQLQGDSYDHSNDIFELIDGLEKSVYEIQNSKKKSNMAVAKDVYIEAMDDIVERKKSPDHITGVPSGILSIDKATHGWQKGDLIVLAARPAMGKTGLALTMLDNMTTIFKRPAAIYSLEMPKIQLMHRLIAIEEDIELSDMRSGKVTDPEFMRIMNNSRISQAPLYIDDTPGLTIMELRASARKLVEKYEVELIVVDYLQLMSGDKSQRGNREQEISTISRGMKEMAKELNIPVIALAQLSRSVEQRGGEKIPLLSDLRESGSIEQDADFVGFLYRPEYYGFKEDGDGNDTRGLAKLLIAKHRNGALSHCFMRFIGKYTKFLNYVKEDDVQAESTYSQFKDHNGSSFYPEGDTTEDMPF